MSEYSIGLDYGTNSCRSLIIDLSSGAELGSSVFPYPSGELGILTDSSDPNVARQNPQDYLDGCVSIIREAITQAEQADSNFSVQNVISIGIDTTGSTIIPVDDSLTPLSFSPKFNKNLNAHVWLWKDHTAHIEAEKITSLAQEIRPEYLSKCGGTYSSEWWWSKILRLKNIDSEVFQAAHSFLEHCDWLPAILSGISDTNQVKRSICAAGHKALFHDEWGGLPDSEFLNKLDPTLGSLRNRLYSKTYSSDTQAGKLCPEWAEKLGLPADIAISVGAFDCHMGAVGAGVKPGTMVKVLGTSTCDISVAEPGVADVPGLCGQVPSSVIPGLIGIEAGQSAVGDIFLWLTHQLVPDSYGETVTDKFINMEKEMSKLKPGESGLLALDWNNGNRSVLTDTQLTGLLIGQTLHTKAHEIYRAYIEATAFGALTIINRMEEHGVGIQEIICTGGLAHKNKTLMQLYADITGRPMKVATGDQTCAQGAAMLAAVSTGSYSLETLQKSAILPPTICYQPIPENQSVYQEIYSLYLSLHDAFSAQNSDLHDLSSVMKKLITIRQKQRS